MRHSGDWDQNMTDDLTWMSATEIRRRIGAKEISPVEVTDHFLNRIAELDPKLNAFLWLDPTAREQARAAEAAVARGDELGPLHGIPISIKELIPVEGQVLYGGTKPATVDDVVVTRVRDAGAVVIGTNSMMGSRGSLKEGFRAGCFDWDSVESRNPWDLDRVPGWSSSGSAAAVAGGLVPVAIGTDGGGSTRLPAAYSGIFGLHPTSRLVPTVEYDVPGLPSPTRTKGPLTRSVADAALLLQVIAGPDGRDFTCLQSDPPDYCAQLDDGVQGLRFAWTDDFGFTDKFALDESPRVIETIRAAAQGFAKLGANIETTSQVWEEGYQTWPGLAFLFPNRVPQPVPTLEFYRELLNIRGRNWNRCRELFATYDILLSPTAQLTARSIDDWEKSWVEGRGPYGEFMATYTSHTVMFNVLGFPAASIPCGYVDGLPVGLQIIAPPGNDAKVLRVARAFEMAFPRNERPSGI
jgi:aspartyl-tRNA(Asn)/glutamyl-tRNA(Gln) amidotransferase subunit A